MEIKIGSRGSDLALIQTNTVMRKLKEANPAMEANIEVIKTSGDLRRKPSGDGVFVKEIDMAVLNGEIDIGVHSLKDEPTSLPKGLSLRCVPERLDPADVLVTEDGSLLEDLPGGAIIGTGSPRRRAEIARLRPDLELHDIRGNIPTRIEKVQNGGYDGLITSCAALKRMELEDVAAQKFEPSKVIPAAGQGALGVVCREGEESKWMLTEINNEEKYRQTTCERTFLKELGLGCRSSVGAIAETVGGKIKLLGGLSNEDGRQTVEMVGKDPFEIGSKAGKVLKDGR